MKDQATAAMNSLSQAGSLYANLTMQHMHDLTELMVKENARLIEQAQTQFHALAQATSPTQVFQLASEHTVTSSNESLSFALKAFTLGSEDQANLLSALHKQLADSREHWQAALEMGQRTLETTLTTSPKNVELRNGSTAH